MENKHFNRELCKRFVNDNHLPIPATRDKDRFFYYVDLYEDIYGSRSLYNDMCNEIDINFGGNSEAFFKHFYDARDKMIKDILENPRYKDFLSFDMNDYKVCEPLKIISKGNVYNCSNIGKVFLSIDLSKANFQAMKFFDKSLVNDEDSYDEYLSRYTSSEYVHRSKYTRQVVFGKCNAGRQITIEKYLISKFFEDFNYDPRLIDLVRFDSDELVFEIPYFEDYTIEDRKKLVNTIDESVKLASKNSGVEVSYKVYKLEAMCLHSERSGKNRKPNYLLIDLINGGYKFKDVPQTYHAMVYKLLNGMELNKNDYYFRYEGLDVYIDDEFTLRRFKTKKEFEDGNREVEDSE